jgi:outer membrane protein assembly factor BamB
MLHAALKALAAVSALFGVVVAAFVLVTSLRLSSVDPLTSQALSSLKQRVGDQGADESLYADIRNLDLLAREAYFTSQDRLTAGVVLFLCAWAISVGSLQVLKVLSGAKPPAVPRLTADKEARTERAIRAAVIAVGGLLAAACVTSLALVPTGAFEPGGKAAGASEALPAVSPSADPEAEWPAFRGPRAGVATETADPAWDSGRLKVLWTTPVPLKGFGSPVIWGSSIYLSAADETKQIVMAFDADTGAMRWRTDVSGSGGAPEISPNSSFATPTMACNARGAYALFASGRVVCLNPTGAIVWRRDLGRPDNAYGLASSLSASASTLFVQFDQTENPALIALDAATGRNAWTAPREGNASWASPILVTTSKGPLLVVTGNPNVEGFDPATGKSLWRVKLLSGDVVTSPAFYGDTVYVASQYAVAAAIPLSRLQTLWESEYFLPDISSPLATANGVYLCMTRGKLTCLDQKTGEPRWTSDLKTEVNASPILLGDLVIVVAKNGTVHAFAERPVGAPVKPAWSFTIGGTVMATPAFKAGRLYVRSDTALVCVAPEAGK